MTDARSQAPPRRVPVPDWALQYRAQEFPPWSLTADVIAVAVDLEKQALQAALVVRGRSPFSGYDAWPGGFVQWDSDPDGQAAARREFEEETRREPPELMTELGTYDASGRDPRQFAGHPDPDTGDWVPTGTRVVSRAFVAPLRKEGRRLSPSFGSDAASSRWAGIYTYLPWEDVRDDDGRRDAERALRDLTAWASSAGDAQERDRRRAECERLFSLSEWDEEATRERWDLLREAGLVEEAWRDRWGRTEPTTPEHLHGRPLAFDHRTILADALAWLRREVKRQPRLVQALIRSEFKLSELQTVFEAVSGRRVYRTNFRRLVSALKGSRMVEPAGRMEQPTGPGKPAEFYRFEASALRSRHSPGLTLPWLPSSP